MFLTKTHISVKKILLKSIKEGKNPWFFHDTSFIFTRRNSHERIQNKFLTKIYSGKCWHILSFGSHSEKLAQFFNVIIWTISSHLHKISVDFFGLVLKPDKLEGASQGRNLWIFHSIEWILKYFIIYKYMLHKYFWTEKRKHRKITLWV